MTPDRGISAVVSIAGALSADNRPAALFDLRTEAALLHNRTSHSVKLSRVA